MVPAAKKAIATFVMRVDADAPWTREGFDRLMRRRPTNPALKAIAADRALLEAVGSSRLPDDYLDWQSGPLRRTPKEISLSDGFGRLLYLLVSDRKPKLTVEAGTGFGISGCYIAAGLAAKKTSSFITFEMGDHAEIARQILPKYHERTLVVRAKFEDFPKHLSASADIDFLLIDAIHHNEIVAHQMKSVLGYCAPGAVLVVDDAYQRNGGKLLPILRNFSTDRRISFAATLGKRFFVCAVR